MTDNEILNDNEEKELSWYAKQRAKYKEEIDAINAKYEAEKAGRIQDKISYFKNTLSSQGYQGDFDEFANKYAWNLWLDEMVALYKWINWAVQATAPAGQQQQQQEEPKLWPTSVVWTNPIGGDQAKDFSQLSIEEMKAYGRQNFHSFD